MQSLQQAESRHQHDREHGTANASTFIRDTCSCIRRGGRWSCCGGRWKCSVRLIGPHRRTVAFARVVTFAACSRQCSAIYFCGAGRIREQGFGDISTWFRGHLSPSASLLELDARISSHANILTWGAATDFVRACNPTEWGSWAKHCLDKGQRVAVARANGCRVASLAFTVAALCFGPARCVRSNSDPNWDLALRVRVESVYFEIRA
jgi:hypothetical protein